MAEKLETCPYNKAHQIRPERLLVHLAKCRQSNQDSPKVTCRFNVAHIIPECERQIHEKNCRDNAPFLNKLKVPEAEHTVDLAPIKDIEIECTENWDDVCVPTYNPEERIKNEPILRLKQCVSKSERRKFHQEERTRHQQLHNKGELSSSTSTVGTGTAIASIPLRRPQSYAEQRREFPTLGPIDSSTTSTDSTLVPTDSGSDFPDDTAESVDSSEFPALGSSNRRPRNAANFSGGQPAPRPNHAWGPGGLHYVTSRGRGRGIKINTQKPSQQ